MKRDFTRSKRETQDSILPLSIQIEKKVPRKKNLALQLTVNVAAYIVLFAVLGGMSNLLMFLGLMVAGTAAQIIVEAILSNKDTAKYNAYLKRVEHQVDAYLKEYKDYAESVFVPASKLSPIIENLSSRLFCKLPSHKDFLAVNLGTSTADYPINITYPHFAYNEENSLKAFENKMEKKLNSKKTDILPYGISLRDQKSIAFINKDLSEDEFMSIVNAAVMDLATFQSPEELQMCFAFYPDIDLDWCSYLPHVWYGNRRLVFCDTEPENEFALLMKKAIDDKTKHTVAVVDVDFALETNMYSTFNTENLPDNLSVVFFSVDGVSPTRAKYIVECTKKKRVLTGKAGDRTITLNALSNEDSFDLARKLFNIQLIDNHLVTSKDIPERLTFFELFNAKRAEDLPKANTRESITIQQYFPVLIGYGKDNEKTVLDLTNDGDGNHCLVTGTNGSGKSEFLLTYILSGCAKYSPAYFSFVTIDFKGGLMSSKLRNLPHCLGEFTNGQATLREISRIAKLLESEIDYRERMLNQYGCNGSLAKYHELYKNGSVKTPLPRLLVVVDEAAVFFSEDPSAVNYITKIATVGRQLGIILMLSTQSKNGVIPSQVKTNINVCIDFYSEDGGHRAQSKIKGRAIINSNTKSQYACQVALSSVYDSSFAALDYISASGKSRIVHSQEGKQQFALIHAELMKRYSRPANLGDVLTQNLDAKYQNAPLVLPELQKLYGQSAENAKVFPIGMSDNIFDRNYNFFAYEPSKYNLLVYGASQSGKTTFIKSLLASMFDTNGGYRPSDMHVYIIAKNPQEYLNFTFPHVGNILPESQMYYFLLFLSRAINQRKALPAGSNYPHITAVMDGCYGAVSNVQNELLSSLFSYVVSESVKYRISVILTMSSKPGFMSPGINSFSSKLAFYMGNDFDYSNLLHVDAIKKVVECPGRCLVDIAGQNCPTLETQIALPYRSNEAEISAMRDNYCRLWYGKAIPPSIPLMPEVVSLAADPVPGKIPVGYCEDRSICYWNYTEVNTYLVSYFADRDAISFIRYVIDAFSCKNADIIVVDNQRGVLANARNLHNVLYCDFNDKSKLQRILNERQNNKAPTRDTVLIMLDFARLLGFSSLALEKELATSVASLIQNKKYRCHCVLAEFKDYINSFRTATSTLALGAALEGAGSGLLLGRQPCDHTFGFAALSFKEQNAALNTGWGIHVSPATGETKKIKFAVEVNDCGSK